MVYLIKNTTVNNARDIVLLPKSKLSTLDRFLSDPFAFLTITGVFY